MHLIKVIITQFFCFTLFIAAGCGDNHKKVKFLPQVNPKEKEKENAKEKEKEKERTMQLKINNHGTEIKFEIKVPHEVESLLEKGTFPCTVTNNDDKEIVINLSDLNNKKQVADNKTNDNDDSSNNNNDDSNKNGNDDSNKNGNDDSNKNGNDDSNKNGNDDSNKNGNDDSKNQQQQKIQKLEQELVGLATKYYPQKGVTKDNLTKDIQALQNTTTSGLKQNLWNKTWFPTLEYNELQEKKRLLELLKLLNLTSTAEVANSQ